MSGTQWLGLVSGIIILVTLFEMLRRHRLRERFAVLWSLIAVGAVVVGLFPALLDEATNALGLQVPTNLLFFVSTLILLGISLQHSFEIGRAEERARILAEEIALLRMEIGQQRRNDENRAEGAGNNDE